MKDYNNEFCMQIKDLNSLGYEVIVVTSGAVGLGRQRLKYRRFVNSRLSTLSTFFFYLDAGDSWFYTWLESLPVMMRETVYACN